MNHHHHSPPPSLLLPSTTLTSSRPSTSEGLLGHHSTAETAAPASANRFLSSRYPSYGGGGAIFNSLPVSASARTSMTKVGMIDDGEDIPAPGASAVTPVAQDGTEQQSGTRPSLESGPQQLQQQQEPSPVSPESTTSPQALPQCTLTFLTVSGRRRNMTFEPEATVGRVKELLWNAWPTDWTEEGERPPGPSYLRILHLGRILQEEDTLASVGIQSGMPSGPATVVHLSVRPAQASNVDRSDSVFKKKKAPSSADQSTGGGCCGACIIS